MRHLLAGGRHLDDGGLVRAMLDALRARHSPTVLIHGGHPDLGPQAEAWARRHDLHVIRYPANRHLHGRRAEMLRNAFMLVDSRPDLVLALPGGADTADLVARAHALRLTVLGPADPSCGSPAPNPFPEKQNLGDIL